MSVIRTVACRDHKIRFTRNALPGISDAPRFCYSAPMITRVIVLVIDGLGVGALPDAAEYGDAGSNTLSHLAEAVGGLTLPTLEALGLGHITEIKGVRTMGQPEGCFGRLGFLSKEVDSIAGYWEMAGHLTDVAGPLYPNGFPPDMVGVLEQAFGRKIVGNRRCLRNRPCCASVRRTSVVGRVDRLDGWTTNLPCGDARECHASGRIFSALPGREKTTQGPLGNCARVRPSSRG